MNDSRKGKLVVISGPSGTGKTSICEGVLNRQPDSRWSVSVTTRPRRGHEVDGQDYHFITREQYDRMLAGDELLEHAEYLGHGYGTPRKQVDEAVAAGAVIVMEIDVQGGAQIAEKVPESIRIFVLPPTMDTLKARLEGRKTESEEIQRKRLDKADGEIGFAKSSGVYQYFITNDILEDSIAEVLRIIQQEIERE